ncbi:ATP-binding protein [Flavobacterium sp. W21_SRS_FM6]|uniref:ATP-binding protein n=1 Tax=Flavobacterium sp. W21_SRS_FM6 TaxID=3240268 RepID=UPI003F9119FC
MYFEEEIFNCEKHGEVKSLVRWTHSDDGTYGPASAHSCIECKREIDQAKRTEEERLERIEEEKRQAQILLRALQVPQRYENEDFTTYKAINAGQKAALKACRNYADNFNELSKAGGGLLLVGGLGTGKTHLAISIGKTLVTNKIPAMYVNLAKVIKAIRASWNDRDIDESELYWKLTKPKLLIIDEVGVQAGTENERNIIFEIINARYEYQHPTILISNLPENEITHLIGERVIDRVKEGRAGTIVFDWPSYRQRAA